MIKNAINYFFSFHKGLVNIILHTVGFVGIFYSVYKLSWVLFGVFILVLECGHFYNHFTGIQPYDFTPKVIFSRISGFLVIVFIFFLISNYLF